MFRRLYARIMLAILPSAEDYVAKVGRVVSRLEALEDRLESYVEEEVVKLAHHGRQRRVVVDTIHSVMDRRDNATMDKIASARAHLDRAQDARNAVSKVLNGQ